MEVEAFAIAPYHSDYSKSTLPQIGATRSSIYRIIVQFPFGGKKQIAPFDFAQGRLLRPK